MNSPAPSPPSEDVRQIGLGRLVFSHGGKTSSLRLVASSCFMLNGTDGRKNRLLFASAVGTPGAVESFEAALGSRGDAEPVFSLRGDAGTPYKADGVVRDNGFGYEVERFKLPQGLVHIVAQTTRRGFMPTFSNRALWNCLSSEEYTTPVLRTWMKPLHAEFLEQKLVSRCENYQCMGLYLNIGPNQLDRVICNMVKAGKLEFKE